MLSLFIVFFLVGRSFGSRKVQNFALNADSQMNQLMLQISECRADFDLSSGDIVQKKNHIEVLQEQLKLLGNEKEEQARHCMERK